jgi:arylsulfatase A-like enzyme
MTLRRLVLSWLLVMAALPASWPVPAALGATPEQPNIVLLIGDDHGWPYSGFMGDPIAKTPNLDALAAGGTLFTEAQSTSSVCIPSLRALLAAIHTDQWDTHRAAVEAELGPQRFRTEVAYYWTVPRALAWRGYQSWEGGKLWEGTFAQAGFTQGMATEPSTLFASTGDHFGRDGWEDGSALDPLRRFLDTVGDKPFFTWIAPLLPHYPYDAPEEFQRLYVNLGLTWNEAGYYANISWLDALAGAIVAELDARGLRDNTLLVYLSDNGIGIDQPFAGSGQGLGSRFDRRRR